MATKIAVSLYRRICSVFARLINKIRVLHFRLSGMKIGKNCVIGRGITMVGNISIGDRTTIGDYTCLSTLSTGELMIGKDCHINSLSIIGAAERVVIDDHCIFAAFVQITDATHEFDYVDCNIKDAAITSIPVHIHKNVWLGSGVVVLRGVTIGEGSVVGAASLVKKSLPDNSVSFGIPAKIIRERKFRDT